MNTSEVAKKYNVARITVIKWCQKNGVKRQLGKTGIMEYVLDKNEIKQFLNRPNKGRPKKDKKKQ